MRSTLCFCLLLAIPACSKSASVADASVTPDAATDAATDRPDATAPTCGDAVCDAHETCSACRIDCGECPSRNTAHFDIPPQDFAGSVDFVDAVIHATATGVTHTIILERYHGTAGAVSVDYLSAGAAHEVASGTISWADGEAGRKSFTLRVNDHSLAGEERVYVDLLNPSGGVRLGRGAYSRMYVVTDDGSESPDAVWADSTRGDDAAPGTKAAPVQSVSRAMAIAEEGSHGFVYLQGVFDVTLEQAVDDLGNMESGIYLPTRTSEADRLVIRSAPGELATIDGVDNSGYNRTGFFASDNPSRSGSFVTISHLRFRRVIGAVVHRYSNAEHATVESCDISDLDGPRGSNISGIAFWGVRSAIIFDNTVSGVRIDGELNQNGACLQSYSGRNIFVQQNSLSDCYGGFYHKRSPQTDGTAYTSLTFRRNLVSDVVRGVKLSISGSTGAGHSYSLISQNLFRHGGDGSTFIAVTDPETSLPLGQYNEFTHNIIDRRAVHFDYAVIGVTNHLHTSFFGNIVIDELSSRTFHRYLFSADAAGYPAPAMPSDDDLFDTVDYNVYITDGAMPLVYTRSRNYSDATDLAAARTWGIEGSSVVVATHDLVRLPDLTEPFSSGDFHLEAGSPFSNSAPGSLPVGAYIYGDEQFGAVR